MSNITFCWELGAGYGHIAGFKILADELMRRNHTICALLRDTTYGTAFFEPDTVKIEMAPFFRSSNIHSSPTISYPDIIQRLGYASMDTLLPLVEHWRSKFIEHKTELIIADHSPTALLAARTLDIPATDYGNGFFSPPPIYPLPSLTPWLQPEPGFLEHIENQVLIIINEILNHYSKTNLSHFYELFEIEENFLCTFAELDHYSGRSADVYWGPRFSGDTGVIAQWPENDKKNIFVYVNQSYPFLDKLLRSFERIEANILIHCAGLSNTMIKSYTFDNTVFSKEPVQMNSLTGKADLLISHSGHGSVAAFLLMGIPQLAVPRQLEQMMLAHKLKHLGLCEVIFQSSESVDYARIINQTMHNDKMKKQASLFANYYYGFDQQQQIEEIALCCEDIIAG